MNFEQCHLFPNNFTQIQIIFLTFINIETLLLIETMDYSKKVSQTSKQWNYIQSKPMNEQIKELITEQLKKKKNKNNKLMNKKKLLHKKSK